MNPQIENLRQRLTALSDESKKLLAKNQDFTQEDAEKIKANNAEIVTLKTQMESIAEASGTLTELDKLMNEPRGLNYGAINSGGATVLGQAPDRATAQITTSEKGTTVEFDGYGAVSEKQWNAISENAYKQAFHQYVRCKGDLGIMDRAVRNQLQEGIDSEGGFLVPPQYLPEVFMKKPAPTRIYGRVRKLPCSSDSLHIPTVEYSTDDIYTTGIRVTNTGEVPASSTTHRVTRPTFGQRLVTIGTWMLSMPITQDLIEDSTVPLLAWSQERFDETVGLLFDNQILNGTGIGTAPHGIFKNPGGTNEPAVVVSSTNDQIDADQIRGLPFELPEQYLDNAAWTFNRASVGKRIAQFKSTTGEYLWNRGGIRYGQGIADGYPDTLDGFPIAYSAFNANEGNGAFVGAFGDFLGYTLAYRTTFSVRVLNELYAETNQLLLIGRLRFGGVVGEPWKLKIIKSDT